MGEPGPVVGDVSEREVLRRILDRLPASAALVGPGDDAAVLAVTGPIVATVDTLVHGPDFRLAWSSAEDLGWKAAAVNLADVAAMGARPTALLVALAMPDDTELRFVEGLADGLAAACAELAPDCRVEGGDLTVSDTLTIAVTALGDLDGRPSITRSGARPGDVVAVAGELGVAARGLRILFAHAVDAEGAPTPLDEAALSAADRHAVDRQRRPRPTVVAGLTAGRAGATAMMDVSDGFAIDADRMARASGVRIALDAAALAAVSADGDVAGALHGGEDHALLATFPVEAALPEGFRTIGRVADGDPGVTLDGRPVAPDAGWDPYRDWDAGLG